MARLHRRILALLAVFSAAASSVAAQDPIAAAFQYLRGFSPANVYAGYSGIFDFFVYLLIFLGISRTAFEEQFKGRGGKALITGIGIALSLSLAVAEQRFSFNLGSLSPIAGGIILLILGFLLFQLFSKLGIGLSGPLSFVLIYFFASSITPELFTWIAEKLPILNLILAVAVIISIVSIIHGLWSRYFPSYPEGRIFRKLVAKNRIAPDFSSNQNPEADIIKIPEPDFIKKEEDALVLVRKVISDAGAVISGLVALVDRIDKQGMAGDVGKSIIPSIQEIVKNQKEILTFIFQFRSLVSGLSYPEKERAILLIKILKPLSSLDKHFSNFTSNMERAFESINAGNIKSARQSFLFSIEAENEIKTLLDTCEKLIIQINLISREEPQGRSEEHKLKNTKKSMK